MRLAVDLKTGERQSLTSWRSENDPSPGNFSISLDPQRLPQVFVYKDSKPIWRSGQWNGKIFIGLPRMISVYQGFNIINDNDANKVYVTYLSGDVFITWRLMVDWKGEFKQIAWNDKEKKWAVLFSRPLPPCDVYGVCGPFSICNPSNSPTCNCLKGFKPNSVEEWRKGNWSGGCVRRSQLQCAKNGSSVNEGGVKEDGFLKLDGVKLPDFADWLDVLNSDECENGCLKNCSCIAYSYASGIGCMIWSPGGNMMDIQEFSYGGEQLHIRLPHSELGKKKPIRAFIIIPCISLGTIIILASCFYILYRWIAKKRGRKRKIEELFNPATTREGGIDTKEAAEIYSDRSKNGKVRDLPLFDFGVISSATNNFSGENMLGAGGFGPVYKGKLPEGQVVAVKRLSRGSGQGLKEFKNEVILISKLQHRNLVRLLGCCIEGEEKMLLYEYMPNKSLDVFLFDQDKQEKLNWAKRFNILEGIARGLLYLHRDSRLRIIHRDLKASNILLDDEMNPKISDFGMARIFGGNQTLANTNRVVGT